MALADTLKTDLNAPVVRPSQQYEKETIAPLREKMMTSLESEANVGREKEMQQASSQANLSASMATYDTQASEKLHNDPNLIKYQEAIDQKSKAAFIPDQENPQRLAAVLAITNLLGIAIGGKGKNSAQTALAAQNGMLEGYQQGRADIIKQQKDIFDTNQKQLDKTIENLHRGFQDALALAPTDRKAAEEKAMSTINQENADFLRELYNKTGLVGASKTIAELLKQAESRQKLMQQEEMKMIRTPHEIETEAQGRERNRIMAARESRESAKGKSDKFIGFTDDGKLAVFSTSEGGIRVAQAPEGVDFSKVMKVGARDKMTEPTQLGGNSLLKNVIGKTAKTDKIAGDINNNAMAITRIDNLLTRLQDPEIRLGVQSKLNTIKEQAKSMFGEQGEMSTEQVNSLINNVVNPTDKNAVFQKDALFTAFEAERAAQGGRLTVQMMKQAGSVLDPTNYTKEGYAGVLGGRRQTLVNNLRSQNLNDSDVGKLTNHFAKDQPQVGGVQTPSETTKKMPSQEKLQAYADAHAEFGGDVEKAKNHLYGLGYR